MFLSASSLPWQWSPVAQHFIIAGAAATGRIVTVSPAFGGGIDFAACGHCVGRFVPAGAGAATVFPATMFPVPLSGSKDWAKAGDARAVATIAIPMIFFMAMLHPLLMMTAVITCRATYALEPVGVRDAAHSGHSDRLFECVHGEFRANARLILSNSLPLAGPCERKITHAAHH